MNQLKLQIKNMILIKKYIFMIVVVAIGVPLYVYHVVADKSPVLLPLFIQVSFTVYFASNQLEIVEYKYKGNTLLCTTPFTRKSIVWSKYIFVISWVIACAIIYAILSIVLKGYLAFINSRSLVTVFSIIMIIYSLYIPILLKSGYDKAKYLPAVLTFIVPYLLVWLSSKTELFDREDLVIIPNNLYIILIITTIIILFISVNISYKIYKNIDL